MGKISVDLSGNIIGDWIVKQYIGNGGKWECESYSTDDAYGLIKAEITTSELMGNKLRTRLGVINKRGRDFTGDIVGNLRVIRKVATGKWECICNCRYKTVVVLSSNDIIHSKRLGCIKCKGKDREEIKVGDRFGAWVALENEDINIKNIECKCSHCNHTIKRVLKQDLLSGKSRSCGCTHNKFIDLKGNTFGSLEVEEYVGDSLWKCRCSCGSLIEVHTYKLRTGNTKSCGCKKRELSNETNFKRYGEISIAKIEEKRDLWQIEVLNSKEKLIDYITNLKYTPTYTELTQLLNVNYSTISQKVRKYDIEYLISILEGTSEKEKELLEYVKSVCEYEIISNTFSIINNRELDIYIPELSIAIEFNGTYWHSDLHKEASYHQSKTIACAKQGIQLIHIFEYEWDVGMKRKILEKYIRNILIGNKTIVESSDTYVETFKNSEDIHDLILDVSEYEKGYTIRHKTSNEILIMLTTNEKDNEILITNYYYKANNIVVDGIAKMLNSIGTNKKIIIDIDICKINGNSLVEAGFITSIDNISKPDYIWVNPNNNDILTKVQAKNKLAAYNCTNTEENEMRSRGYYRIYNSGNLRLEWSKRGIN